MPNPKDNTTPLPEELRAQIEAFRKKLWKIKITEAVLAGIFGLLFSFILILIVERYLTVPTWLRVVNLILGFSVFSVFAPLWINRWVFRHRKENQLARLISAKFPHLGDRLLGVIELEGQDSKIENVSPELRAAAMRTVAHEAKKRDLDKALPDSWHKRWTLGVISGLAITALAFFLMPKEGMMSSLKRWFTPWTETERFTFTQINDEQYKDGYIVPLGEDFSMDFTLKDNSATHPDGKARYGADTWKSEDFVGDTLSFGFKGKTKKDTVDVKIGDAETTIEVIPTARPLLKNTFATVELPDYLERTQHETTQLSGDTIQALKGSKVTFHSTANRNLTKAIPGILYLESDIVQQGEDESFEASELKLPVNIDGSTINTGPLLVSDKIQKFSLNWVDTFNLAAKRPANYRIEPLTDEAPTAYIERSELEFERLLTETFKFKISNNDDLGIKRAGISWSGELYSPGTANPAKGESTPYFPSKGEVKDLDFAQEVIFNPQELGITTPQRLTIRAWVEDQLPGRKRVYSEQVITVELLTKEMMKQVNNAKLDPMLDRLNSAIEKAAEIEEETQNQLHFLKKANQDAKSPNPNTQKKAKIKQKEIQEKLAELQAQEQENQEDLKELEKDAKELFNKAAPNETMERDTLKKLDEMTRSLEKAQDKKKQAQDNLQKAQDKIQQNSQKNDSETEQEAEEQVKKANQKQKEAIEEMQKAAKKAQEGKEKGEQATFVNRLKQLAKEQMAVHSAIYDESHKAQDLAVDYHPFGNSFEQIIPSQKKAFSTGYKLQKKLVTDLEFFQEELAEYAARSGRAGFNKVVEAMDKAQLSKTQEAAIERFKATEWSNAARKARYCSKVLDQWAKLLAAAGNKKDDGAGGGGQQQEGLNDEDFDFMLRIMKMVKEEQNIREKTRSMELLNRTYEAKKAANK